MRHFFLFLFLAAAVNTFGQPGHDLLAAPYTLFYDDGKVKETFTNVEEKDGRTREFSHYWPNGLLKERRSLLCFSQNSYKEHFQQWQEDGLLTRDVYTDVTQPEGFDQVGKEYYANGVMAREWEKHRAGIRSVFKIWYQNGALGRTFSNSNGGIQGEYHQFDSLGVLRYFGNYSHGIRHGTCTDFDEKGQVVFTNDYVNGKPKSGVFRNTVSDTTGCKPARYSDFVCDSVGQLVVKVAGFASVARSYGGIQSDKLKRLNVTEMQLAIRRIWNFLSIERPTSFATHLSGYHGNEYYKFPTTNIYVNPFAEGATGFIFESQYTLGWTVFPKFGVMYYTDGCIEFPSVMQQIDIYNTNELDY